MTWEELIEKAKKLNYVATNDSLSKNGVTFSEYGEIFVDYYEGDGCYCDTCLATNRTFDKMYQIMLALED